jgi:phage host-nuclease inhibitor protein Gam
MTDQLTPLPAALALPDEEEPVADEAAQWLGGLLTADPTLSMEEVAGDLSEDSLAAKAVRWEVDGPGSGEWAMRKLAATEAEAGEVREQAQAWVDEIRRWEEAQLRPLASRSAYFTERLTRWLRALREADPKRKSYPLPSGTVSSRTVAPKVEIVDADEVIGWAENCLQPAQVEAVVKIERSVRLAELKKVAKVDADGFAMRDPDTGMAIPGVSISPGGVSFSVKVNGG